MVRWNPEEGNKLKRLQKLCRQFGAPHFLSALEMEEWISFHLESLRKFYTLDPSRILSAFKEAGIKISRALYKALRALQRARANAVYLDYLVCLSVIKSLKKPLNIIPKSLHPDDAAAC